MKEMRGERQRQVCCGYDQGGVRSYTRLTRRFPQNAATLSQAFRPGNLG
jgi:hypothetical protein